jgi:hypothetical protein
VASKHKSAPWFLKQGFFEGIKSFKEFEARTGKLANTVEMGDALEILVEAYLHLDKVLNAKDVWVVGSIPLNIRKALNLPGIIPFLVPQCAPQGSQLSWLTCL